MLLVASSRRRHALVRLGLCLVLLITAIAPVPARAKAEFARSIGAYDRVQAALSAQATNEPAALSAPLSIARSQSAVTLDEAEDGLVTLSFSVTNTLPPLVAPPVTPGATYTESIRLVAGFNRAADPNTAHSVLLTTALPTGVQFVRAVPAPERNGSALAWALADLPPQATLSVTLTVRAAGSAGPLTDEAQAWAMLHGRPVQASSAPVGLVADDLAPWLQRTPDADHLDPFIVAQAAALGHDSTRIVAFVNGLGFEPYVGSLRGARGTLWSAAGNSLDRTSLLIALLRASGVPARYRHGSLSDERARDLLATMFPPALGTIGTIPPGTPVSDPNNDPLLLSETRDHWWVEAFLPSQGWRDVDPAFGLEPGQTFVSTVATDGSDRVAEPPAAQRHTVDLRLRVEHYSVLSSAVQGGLESSYPLSVTLNSFSLVGEPVNLEHLTNQRAQGGALFSGLITDYTPSFIIGDEAFVGQNYQDSVTNFPLATRITVGVWLEIVTRGPDGTTERHERALADRAGFVARRGGSVELPDLGQTPIISEDQVYSLLIAPSTVPPEALSRAAVGSDAIVRDSQAGYALVSGLQGASEQQLTERMPELRAAQRNVQAGVRLSQELLLLQFAAESDFATARLGEQLRVRPVLTTPRVLIASWETRDDVAELRLDLRSNERRTIVYPGQSWEGLIAFNLARGLLDGELESGVLERLSGRPVVSVANMLRQAEADGIPLVALNTDQLDMLANLPISAEAKARITEALTRNPALVAIMPTRPVMLEGQARFGWLEIDQNNGQTRDVSEDGMHVALVDYAFLAVGMDTKWMFAFIGFWHGYFAYALSFVGAILSEMPIADDDLKGAWQRASGRAMAMVDEIIKGISDSAKNSGNDDDRIDAYLNGTGFAGKGGDTNEALIMQGGFKNGATVAQRIIDSQIDPPLPRALGDVAPRPASAPPFVSATVSPGSPALSAGSVNGTLTTAGLALNGPPERTAFYAPALAGLGVGGDGAAYALSNFASTANLSVQNTSLRLPPFTGTLQVAGQPLAPNGGLALVSFTGELTVREADASTDSVGLEGTATDLFTLGLTAPAGPLTPGEATALNSELRASFTSSFTLTVAPPPGWAAEVAANGRISLTPPLGTPAGDYGLLVFAEAQRAPGLPVAATQRVTVAARDGVTLRVALDPQTTVPWGPVNPDAPATGINDGRIQLSDAAFVATLTNEAATAREFTLSVDGLPAGWLVLSGADSAGQTRLRLPAGAIGQVGFAISPTLEILPPAGTAYPFTVRATATDNPARSASAVGSFRMPGLAYSYIEAQPTTLVTAPGQAAQFDLTVQNVGNAAGGFPLTATLPGAGWQLAGLPPVTNVGAGEVARLPIQIMAPPNAPTNQRVTLSLAARSGPYTQTLPIEVSLVAPEAICVYTAANAVTGAPAIALRELGAAVSALASTPSEAHREATASQLRLLADLVAGLPGGGSAAGELRARAALVLEANDAASLQAALAGLCREMDTLGTDLALAQRHGASVRFAPGTLAALPAQAVSAELVLRSQGREPTTYEVRFSGAPGLPAPQTLRLAPDEEARLPLSFSSAETGFLSVQADLTAVDASGDQLGFATSAKLGVQVVTAFVRVLRVELSPDFVETGVSSSTVRLEVANLVGMPRPATADLRLLAPDGSTVRTLSVPLTIVGGDPTSYTLGTLDSSALANGVYTATVVLRDPAGAAIPGGDGFGFLTVGEGLAASVDLAPLLVAPGSAVVTTSITTQIRQGAVLDQAAVTGFVPVAGPAAAPVVDGRDTPAGVSRPQADPNADEDLRPQTEPAAEGDARPQTDPAADEDSRPQGEPDPQDEARPQTDPAADEDSRPQGEPDPQDEDRLNVIRPAFIGPGITRYEENDATFSASGTWDSTGLSHASGGNSTQSRTAGDVISATLTSAWLHLGLATGPSYGRAEVLIDGVSQGEIDLYSRVNGLRSVAYANLGPGPHTIEVRVLGSRNPLSGDNWVNLDYLDAWDGTSMPEGTFEETDPRVGLSGSWFTRSDGEPSGGSYLNGYTDLASAWFPFTGDSVGVQLMVGPNYGRTHVRVDGQSLGLVDLRADTVAPKVFAFEGLGDGPHVLQIEQYRDDATLDAITVPGSAPFYTPPVPTGVIRYEEDDPALRYNGQPLATTARSWGVEWLSHVSGGSMTTSRTAGDVISATLTSAWLHLGLATGPYYGRAEVLIDGVSQGEIDLYSRVNGLRSVAYANLGPGPHTIEVRVLGSRNPLSGDNWVNLDYLDAWDGTSMPEGTFEETDPRVGLSGSWFTRSDGEPSGGSYLNGYTDLASAWFPFTGDSVGVQLMVGPNYGRTHVRVDGQSLGLVDLRADTVAPKVFAFEGLGDGPHVLQIEQYRDDATLDAITVPGSAPFYTPPVPTGVIRYEEDDPALRYNGQPLATTARSWGVDWLPQASGGYMATSRTAGDVISATLTSEWLHLGLATGPFYGQAEVLIDGVSRESIDTYSESPGLISRIYRDLGPGPHTLEVRVLGTSNPLSGDNWIGLDYLDAWDGTDAPTGLFTHESERVFRSRDWDMVASARVPGGSFIEDGSSAWFLTTGDEVTLIGATNPADANGPAQVEVWVDGVSRGPLDLSYAFSRSPLPLRLTGLGAGPHVIQITNLRRGGLVGFDSSATPFVGIPMVEWSSDVPASNDGYVITTISAGDLTGDGSVELALSSGNGNLYIYRGDGQDAGDGTPIIWQREVGLGDTPALVDLDGDGLVEVIVGSDRGVFAFAHDGTPLWSNSEIRPHTVKFRDYVFESLGWGGAAVANLDADPEAEIVAVGHLDVRPNPGVESQRLLVFKADGTVAARYDLPISEFQFTATPPLLADLTGDGRPEILVGQRNILIALSYANGTLSELWRRTTTITYGLWGEGTWGSPAVGNLDGNQPGGDPDPEIVMVWDTKIELLKADGSLVWSYDAGQRLNPGSVSLADVDGDGEVEIVTVMKRPWPADEQDIIVLNADGSLLWTQPVFDRTTSSSGVTVMDLDGDGRYEVVWNGAGTGLAIFQGSDGTLLFNEPLINSGTVNDYPIIADVDGDGQAEIIAGDNEGFYVVGFSDWGSARPLWNQYNYHITNINDDLTVPFSEPESWRVHNTYRTQSPLQNPVPVYTIDLTHTLPVSGVIPLEPSFSNPPLTPAPDLAWRYRQEGFSQPTRTTSFATSLPDLRPGEVRAVSLGTEVSYALPSGRNTLRFDPLYVTAARLITVRPLADEVAPGGLASYEVTLHNAGPTTNYSLAVLGLPPGWADLPASVELESNSTVTLTLRLNVPADTALEVYPFVVTATTDAGVQDQAPTTLTVSGSRLQLEPSLREARFGQVVTYTVTLDNPTASAQDYALRTNGLEGNGVALPATLSVPAGAERAFTLTVTATGLAGLAPFSVEAQASDGSLAAGTAALNVIGGPAVTSALSPAEAHTGPGAIAALTLTVTNLGSMADSYRFTLEAPTGWQAVLSADAEPVTSLRLLPVLFNRATLQLAVTPPPGTLPGRYPIRVRTTSALSSAAVSLAEATVVVSERGVGVAISPASATLAPDQAQTWTAQVTNLGSTADSFALTLGGVLAANARLEPAQVTLDAGATTQVQVQVEPLPFLPPGGLSFAVTARSQGDPTVSAAATARANVLGFNGVALSLSPEAMPLPSSGEVRLLAVITNTGNLDAIYDLQAESNAASWQTTLDPAVVFVPAGRAVAVLLSVSPSSRSGPEHQIFPPLIATSATSPPSTLRLRSNPAPLTQTPITVRVRAVVRGDTASAEASALLEAATPVSNERVYLPLVRR
ncbi:FG-GAP-like repeat-containing protein [Candidatus Chloroploca asiatica]|uniref:Transglutaminase-like domain-containing protein n=1 Tax=Candidatus Chloroploca asiatica TaxID=1506545 RepID=A0A2H3L2U0_9CHLR|nr:FG-GAP-like repeat-containing protein [Candidatus Chloroploca asiatica]PDV97447.1 hypothetical protein A9Q02_18300 [Candidatus Chloroploca asiatica]